VCLLRGTAWNFTIHISLNLSIFVSIPQSVCQSQTLSNHSVCFSPSASSSNPQYAPCTFLKNCQTARCLNTEGYHANKISQSVLNMHQPDRQYPLTASNNTQTPTTDAQYSLQSVGPSPSRPEDCLVALQHINLFDTAYCVHHDGLVTDVTSTIALLYNPHLQSCTQLLDVSTILSRHLQGTNSKIPLKHTAVY